MYKTRKYGPLFGLLHPTVMDVKASPSGSAAVMQIELCGGVHGLADLARGIQVPSPATHAILTVLKAGETVY